MNAVPPSALSRRGGVDYTCTPHDHKNEKQECYTAPRKNIKIFKKKSGDMEKKNVFEKKLRVAPQ